MYTKTKARDKKKAAVYVATVRPAMVRREGDDDRKDVEVSGGRGGDGGEGGVETGEGAVPTDSVDNEMVAECEELAETSNGDGDKQTSRVEVADEDSSDDERSEANIKLSREERKRARKQKKQQSAKVRLIRQREAERQAKSPEQAMIQPQLEERQREATETLQQFEAMKQEERGTAADDGVGQRNAARLSQVKHRDGADRERRESSERSLAEQIGADDGLPTAVME
ncbi:hypothetical protein V7S43_011637 [Phytophthora oleae]|uniref:INO80 complex subunit B-like conserved region domain-containing protein n=1 Tax=Phytophthora oleae TaxID=2107226 RepID=A0ABD3F8P5_9STRA